MNLNLNANFYSTLVTTAVCALCGKIFEEVCHSKGKLSLDTNIAGHTVNLQHDDSPELAVNDTTNNVVDG